MNTSNVHGLFLQACVCPSYNSGLDQIYFHNFVAVSFLAFFHNFVRYGGKCGTFLTPSIFISPFQKQRIPLVALFQAPINAKLAPQYNELELTTMVISDRRVKLVSDLDLDKKLLSGPKQILLGTAKLFLFRLHPPTSYNLSYRLLCGGVLQHTFI